MIAGLTVCKASRVGGGASTGTLAHSADVGEKKRYNTPRTFPECPVHLNTVQPNRVRPAAVLCIGLVDARCAKVDGSSQLMPSGSFG